MISSAFCEVLSAASGGNELGSNPFCLTHTGFLSRLNDFPILVLGYARGNELPSLFLFGKRGPTDIASGFAHGFFSFLGTGVFRNALTASSNLMPLRFGII